MKPLLLLTAVLLFTWILGYGQEKGPVIEPGACPVKIDSTFRTKCGYLVVPENRTKPGSRMIRLPFVVVESKNPNKRKDPIIFTAGGPGGSSLGWATGITQRLVMQDRDCIAFEQRGTKYALPYLRTRDLDTAIKESYRKNLDKDSMILVGVKKYRKTLEARGIDLTGYNTDESATDIDDLMKGLHIDSANLFGGSYSVMLMLTVLRKDPARVRSLVLDSPLPNFVQIDEDEPVNFNEGLNQLFANAARDSADKVLYGGLKERFQTYFTSITGKQFPIRFLERGTKDSITIYYSTCELLDVIEKTLGDRTKLKDIPFIVNEMIKGNHYPFIKQWMDDLFNKNQAPDGMRISVYCSDEMAYHSDEVIQDLYKVYPYMKGYHINDVYKAMCDCWMVPPLKAEDKLPLYSTKPALISDGEMDNACRPLYMDRIHHYMPNSQRILVCGRAHGTGSDEMQHMVVKFLADPYKPLVSDYTNLEVY